MTTQARIDANRATPSSSLCATKHGLFRAVLSVRAEDRQAFDGLRATSYVEIDSAGILEHAEFHTLVEAAWKQQMVRHLEKEALERNEANAETILDRFTRYATALSGSAVRRPRSRTCKNKPNRRRQLQAEATWTNLKSALFAKASGLRPVSPLPADLHAYDSP